MFNHRRRAAYFIPAIIALILVINVISNSIYYTWFLQEGQKNIRGMVKQGNYTMDLKDHHGLYCMGHLIEGAIAYHEATGKDRLLKAAIRFADYVDAVFGPQEGKCKGYPGHEIAEMALIRLYEVTGAQKYLRLAVVADRTFSMNASMYTQEELTEKEHHYELRPCGSTVLCLDYRQAGIGSNSCGPELAEKYRLAEDEFRFCVEMIFL